MIIGCMYRIRPSLRHYSCNFRLQLCLFFVSEEFDYQRNNKCLYSVRVSYVRKLLDRREAYMERECADTIGTVLVPWDSHFEG